jgi:hypothetical protein
VDRRSLPTLLNLSLLLLAVLLLLLLLGSL